MGLKSIVLFLIATSISLALGEAIVTVNTETAPNLQSWVPKLEAEVKSYWNKAIDYLAYKGYTAPKNISIYLNGSCDGGGVISSADIYYICAKSINDKSQDPTKAQLTFIAACTTWSIMSYPPPPKAPFWLTHCTTDYVRWYHYEEKQDLSKPLKIGKSAETAPSQNCAYWLNWIQNNYKREPSLVQQLFKITREGNYTDEVFKNITGKSIQELWDQMQNDIDVDVTEPTTTENDSNTIT